MIQKLNKSDVLKLMCKTTGKWGMMVSFDDWADIGFEYYQELVKAAPWLDYRNDAQILVDGVGFVLADTEKELYDLFYQTVGDDGPYTQDQNPNGPANNYDGPQKIYALTCNPQGQLETENT